MIGKTLGPYRILEEIGAGAMGRVYLAEDNRLGRRVALKVLRPRVGADVESKRRFATEARAASALSHPHILAIYDIGEADGSDYIAMEYVEGETLDEQIRNSGPFPFKTVARIGAQLAAALARAHEAGIVHRDIKPGNIKVSRDGHAKILDFGLARLAERELAGQADTAATTLTRTAEGCILGSPLYMSPEQARGAPVDGRSDLFSLGSVLYELTAGRAPFPAESLVDVLHAIIHDAPPAIRQSVPEVPSEFERILAKCLEKDPADRYQHADDLAVDLRHLQHRLDAAPGLGQASLPPETDKELDTAATIVTVPADDGHAVERGVPKFASRRRLVLFLFDNATADPAHDWLEHAIPRLIGFSLEQDPDLDASWGREYPRMREDGLSRAADLSLTLQRRIAQDFHYGYFLAGSFRAVADGLSVSASLHLARNAKQISQRTFQSEDAEGILALVDTICHWLRESLEIPSRHRDEVTSLPVAEIATRSIAALRAFTEGQTAISFREDWPEGVRLLEKAGAEDPRFAWAQLSLQRALLGANRWEESKKVLRSLMKNRHRLPERYQFEAKLAYHRMRQEPEKALQVTKSWTRLYPHDPNAFASMATVYASMEREDEEVKALQREYELAPDRSRLVLRMGQCLMQQGRHQEALSRLRRYAEDCLRDPEAFTSMGTVLCMLGQFDEARGMFEKALAIEPDDVGIRTHLG